MNLPEDPSDLAIDRLCVRATAGAERRKLAPPLNPEWLAIAQRTTWSYRVIASFVDRCNYYQVPVPDNETIEKLINASCASGGDATEMWIELHRDAKRGQGSAGHWVTFNRHAGRHYEWRRIAGRGLVWHGPESLWSAIAPGAYWNPWNLPS